MFNIHIITLGKLKENYWKNAELEYLKRLSPYAKIKITELKEEPFTPSDPPEKIKAKEAQKIQSLITNSQSLVSNLQSTILIAMHEEGKTYTSPKLAKHLQTLSQSGKQITFIIGGPKGLHKSILNLATHQLSLSALTFPHQMVRTILLEQIYRSITINKGKTYHY